jgi:hypothetical protein
MTPTLHVVVDGVPISCSAGTFAGSRCPKALTSCQNSRTIVEQRPQKGRRDLWEFLVLPLFMNGTVCASPLGCGAVPWKRCAPRRER